MGFHLYQEQTQKLLMTTQMKQAIEVLQCTAQELDQYVAEHVADNPLADFSPGIQAVSQPVTLRGIGTGTGNRNGTGTAAPLEQLLQNKPSLGDALDLQLRTVKAPARVLQVARFLAGCLDESGYLKETDEELASLLGEPVFLITEAVRLLQSCEPAGLAARSLKECLLLQLSYVNEEHRDLVSSFIEEHLEDVAASRIGRLARHFRTTPVQVQAAIDALRSLNPRPGLQYASKDPHYIVPDVTVERVGASYIVLTNDACQPCVRINSAYRRYLQQGDEETKRYLMKKLQSAEWIVRCLEQRRMTLHKVTEVIVDAQKSFLDKGMAYMRPLTLKTVAHQLGMHESTVSRATRGKYMQTPRGVFELKFFFSAEVQTDTGTTSAQAAKHAILKCISDEDPQNPLSDEALVHLLAEQQIHISRRTVAKYRDELRIPTSNRRRRYE